jgi:serine/threonine-protein phosphatase 5
MASEKTVGENGGDESSKAAAVQFKTEANEFFRLQKYSFAADLYSKAIELDPDNAVYYANRSISHLKQENFGYALSDASKAIEMDSTYTKAYYRFVKKTTSF